MRNRLLVITGVLGAFLLLLFLVAASFLMKQLQNTTVTQGQAGNTGSVRLVDPATISTPGQPGTTPLAPAEADYAARIPEVLKLVQPSDAFNKKDMAESEAYASLNEWRGNAAKAQTLLNSLGAPPPRLVKCHSLIDGALADINAAADSFEAAIRNHDESKLSQGRALCKSIDEKILGAQQELASLK